MDIHVEAIIQAFIIAAIVAIVAGYINGIVMASHLKDLKERVSRIEKYLNGLLGGK